MGAGFHILFRFRDEPWGGGNQFLKALREHFRSSGVYAEEAEHADVILFNSHHELEAVASLKRRFPEKVFLHRVDGPIRVVRGSGREVDRLIFAFNRKVADGTVFQSEWSRMRSRDQGMPEKALETVIHNAPDPRFFHPPAQPRRAGQGRIRVIASSWSTNPKKGFEVYLHLDERLDFSRFDMTFVGNSPVKFKNARHVPPSASDVVAEELRAHDIFVSASHLEACSNAIGEALNCGLVALVRNNSSQPELVRDPRCLFEGPEDVLAAVERVAADLDGLKASRCVETMAMVAGQYLEFARRARAGAAQREPFGSLDAIRLNMVGLASRVEGKMGRAWSRALAFSGKAGK